METFLQNLPLICLFIAMSACIICAAYAFFTMPKEKQVAALKEWLKWAVSMAEKELGSGTGQLKLREVYNMAIQQFPWLIRVITFEHFSSLVDEALEWMNGQIETNPAFKSLMG